MREYETVAILHPDLGEEGFREWVGRIRSILEAGGAELQDPEEWGLKELAYLLEGERKGYYVLFRYRADTAAVQELARQLKLSDRILRFLTVREAVKLPPSARGKKASAQSPSAAAG